MLANTVPKVVLNIHDSFLQDPTAGTGQELLLLSNGSMSESRDRYR